LDVVDSVSAAPSSPGHLAGRQGGARAHFDVDEVAETHTVDSAEAALELAESLAALCAPPGAGRLCEEGCGERQRILGLDAEWRPDTRFASNPPSLLQLAFFRPEGHGDEATPSPSPQDRLTIWLVDLLALERSDLEMDEAVASLKDALGEVLLSPSVRIIGFALQHDFDKLASLSGWRCFDRATHVVDLSDAAAGNLLEGGSQPAIGLSAQLKLWTGRTLDKAMQCSDWARRPLTLAQARYAAADVACLFPLLEALQRHSPKAIPERDIVAHKTGARRVGEGVEAHAQHSRGVAVSAGDAVRTVVDKLVETGCCRLATAAEAACGAERVEINSLLFVMDPLARKPKAGDEAGADTTELLLVLSPASDMVDVKWLSNYLGVPKRRVRMATPEECEDWFGAVPGRVPPMPLRHGVRVMAMPSLRHEPVVSSGIVASSGESGRLLLVDNPAEAIPLLAATAHAVLAQGDAADVPFEWLPDPRGGKLTLDDIVCDCFSRAARRLSEGEDDYAPESAEEPFVLTAIVENRHATLARKLRMVGVDCEVAGEYIRTDKPDAQGVARVKVDTTLQDAALRRAAAMGRVFLTTRLKTASIPGPYYLLLGEDADAQFAEVLEVFGLRFLVDAGESRCGICNGRRWRRLSREEAAEEVPEPVISTEDNFYRCGDCGQVFWTGEKYTNAIDALRSTVVSAAVGPPRAPEAASTARAAFTPPLAPDAGGFT